MSLKTRLETLETALAPNQGDDAWAAHVNYFNQIVGIAYSDANEEEQRRRIAQLPQPAPSSDPRIIAWQKNLEKAYGEKGSNEY